MFRVSWKWVLGFALLITQAAQAAVFSFVVLPDTQLYAQNNSPIFPAQTQWILDNQASRNIVFVSHLGDLKDSGGPAAPVSCDDVLLPPGVLPPGSTEWDYVAQALAPLESLAETGLADGLPLGVMPGNHDFDQGGEDPDTCPSYQSGEANGRPLTEYEPRLGDAHFAGRAYYGGSRACDAVEVSCQTPNSGFTGDSYTLFEAEGIGFIVINFAYRAELATFGGTVRADNPEIQWADDLLATNADRIGILVSHFILEENESPVVNEFGTWAGAVYDELSVRPNLFLMLGGHRYGEAWRIEDRGALLPPLPPVHALLANYQGVLHPGASPDYDNLNGTPGNNGDSGLMRILEFDTVTCEVNVDTFSPVAPALDSDFEPASGNEMNRNTASKFGFSFKGYSAIGAPCNGEPVDFALTMDRSGSMNGPSPVSGTKLDSLRNMATQFIDQVELDGVHRIGMTRFNQALVPFPGDFPLTAMNAVGAQAARDAIATMTVAGGLTDVLEGVEGAVDLLDVTDAFDRRAVVLFTDGKHNSPTVLADTALENELGNRVNAVSSDMQFYSIGFGTSINELPLSGATLANDGWHVNEADPLGVAKDFSLVAASIVNNATLIDPVFYLKPGGSDSQDVGVSSADRYLTFVAHWDSFDADRVRMDIDPPGGKCRLTDGVDYPNTRRASGVTHKMIRVNLPFFCDGALVHEGDWQVRLHTSEKSREIERVDLLAFASSAINLYSNLEVVEGLMTIKATLVGKVSKDARFTAYILPPLPDSGDSTDHDRLGSDPGGGASIPKAELVARKPIQVELEISGVSADAIDAVGQFKPSEKGLYQVRVVSNLVDESGQKVSREAFATSYADRADSPFLRYLIFAILFVILIYFAYRFYPGRAATARG
ncbi:MAG: VWA domain-containing protein [Gammaproteobacteria bacterium]|nr:VWA domain-containing protein [Gammaproteobacteria bacterium]